ncbi:MAG: sulfatase family protein, partial [Nitrososphaera sp.]
TSLHSALMLRCGYRVEKTALVVAGLIVFSIIGHYQIAGFVPEAAAVDVTISRPNIVVIMADDLEERSLDILIKNGLVPNIKTHIVDKGITFSNSFVTYPLCCPSRATFLTGQYPHNHDVWHNELPSGGASKLSDTSTIATWLDDAQYHTGFVGKYLNKYGIDTPETYVPPGWDDWQATVGNSTYFMFSYTINDNGNLITYGKKWSDYQTDVLANRSVQYIHERESDDATPFFLYINPLAPHTDHSTNVCKMNYATMQTTTPPGRYRGTTDHIAMPRPPSFNEADVFDKPPASRAPPLTTDHIKCLDDYFHDRLESMRALDDLIRRVVSALSSNGELGKTVIVFTSDNGYLLGEHRLRAKTRVYEESIGVPLYIRIPGVAPHTITSLVANNDLAPTFLELAKAQSNIPIDGRSLIPLVENPTGSWRNGVLIETPSYSAIRTENYVYALHYKNSVKEVYDLVKDPYELENVSGKAPWSSKISSLEDWRKSLVNCEGSSCKSRENLPAP